MVMRSPIPPAIRKQLADDPYMTRCIIDDSTCAGRIEWHHAMQYASKRVNELYTILPACHYHHGKAATWRMKNECEAAMRHRIKYFHAEEDFRTKYPKSDLLAPNTIHT